MATKLRAARLLVYSAADMKENHERYSMEAAMAKQYASDVCLEIVNDALQIFGGSGYMKGMEVERAYRDAKICTIYEGTNEIQRVVIAANIIGKMPRTKNTGEVQKNKSATGYRKKMIFKKGTLKERVDALVEDLKADGYDFTVGIPIDTPINKAERVVSAGLGIGEKENMKLIEDLAVQAGAAIGSSRPVAETLKYVPLNRYIGMSGQKFTGNLYIACGISGAIQHLKGIKEASTIVAINNNPNAKIFKNSDYGIVGDLVEILPLLTDALDNGEPKKAAPPMKKMKRDVSEKVRPTWKYYVCNGCGYEYDPGVGDLEGHITPGTIFQNIPKDWTCPACGEGKDMFIEA
ncbi:acyl-CoA dehydrogenase family protein/electron transfer protein [Clostridium botulinum]|nr:acyl-CoA dehydrogenase family protein/electron transfer protein [Clostridium botulinum]